MTRFILITLLDESLSALRSGRHVISNNKMLSKKLYSFILILSIYTYVTRKTNTNFKREKKISGIFHTWPLRPKFSSTIN